MLIEVQAVDRREDWPGLPGLREHNEQIRAVMRDGDPTERKRERLNNVWGAFTETLRTSEHLTRRDADEIEADVGADIDIRLDNLEAGVRRFEKKAWGSDTTVMEDPADFDFTRVVVRAPDK